ncbi:unnamed protein product, partial [Phaeothamnion confervicola]
MTTAADHAVTIASAQPSGGNTAPPDAEYVTLGGYKPPSEEPSKKTTEREEAPSSTEKRGVEKVSDMLASREQQQEKERRMKTGPSTMAPFEGTGASPAIKEEQMSGGTLKP